ncbi:hypothetical protein NBRC116592_18830 [Colwellia sp. KU-HH00111]|uniref:hypothetical protein n=1 Tax=Colwellia sp. KU-HH00111 TaxID=3127652 RepID=UPI003109679C
MENALYIVLAPWLVFIVFALVAKVLINFAKKRRGIAVAFGIFVQMFSPDPFVERTVETVVVAKQQRKQPQGDVTDKSKE